MNNQEKEWIMECNHPASNWFTDEDGNDYCSACVTETSTSKIPVIPKRPPANRSTKSMFLRFDPIIHAKIRELSIKKHCTYAEIIEERFRDDD